jgi:signal peptidase II
VDIIHRPARRVAFGLGIVVLADLATKLAAAAIAAGHTEGPLVPVRNQAFSFGVADAPFATTILIAFAGIALAAAFTIPRALRGELRAWIPACLIGGALANLADRIAFGSVHDFLATPWVILNLADVAVVAGLLGLLSSARRTASLGGHFTTPPTTSHQGQPPGSSQLSLPL